jgi:hypothetical protein
MRLVCLSAAFALAALPALAAGEARVQLAQAAGGPPTSGWGAPTQAAPAPPASGWSAPGAPSAPPAASFARPGAPQRNCMAEIQPLLTDTEQKGRAIQAAAKTKKQPVVCQAFRNLATAEGKLIKYFEDHGTECGVPPDALKARKANYAKIVEVRTKVCDTAAAPAPRAPSLSDALGTSRLPTVSSDSPSQTRRNSTFDTLTGNPLNR